MRRGVRTRIVVTGASGNIGTATLRRLERDGGHDLVAVARRVPEGGGDHPGVDRVSADLTDDACLDALVPACRGADAVVHLAWGFQPSHDLRYLEELGSAAPGECSSR